MTPDDACPLHISEHDGAYELDEETSSFGSLIMTVVCVMHYLVSVDVIMYMPPHKPDAVGEV